MRQPVETLQIGRQAPETSRQGLVGAVTLAPPYQVLLVASTPTRVGPPESRPRTRTTLGQLLDLYDHNFPTLSAQLGDKVRVQKGRFCTSFSTDSYVIST